jgi:hypothetical protein
MSDKELSEALAQVANKYLVYNYNDVINEMERRRVKREAHRTFWLSLVAVVVAGLSLLASVLLALLK